MSSVVELEVQIKALEEVRKRLDDELKTLTEQLEHRKALENQWAEDPFAKQKKTKDLAAFFRRMGYRIVECPEKISDPP